MGRIKSPILRIGVHLILITLDPVQHDSVRLDGVDLNQASR